MSKIIIKNHRRHITHQHLAEIIVGIVADIEANNKRRAKIKDKTKIEIEDKDYLEYKDLKIKPKTLNEKEKILLNTISSLYNII